MLVETVDLQHPHTLRSPLHVVSHLALSASAHLLVLPNILRAQLRRVALPIGLPRLTLIRFVAEIVSTAPCVTDLALHDGGRIDDVTAFNCGSLERLRTLQVRNPSATLLEYLSVHALFRALVHLELVEISYHSVRFLQRVFQARALRDHGSSSSSFESAHEKQETPPQPLRNLSLSFAAPTIKLHCLESFINYMRDSAISDFGALRYLQVDLRHNPVIDRPILTRPGVPAFIALSKLVHIFKQLTPVFPLGTGLSLGAHSHCVLTTSAWKHKSSHLGNEHIRVDDTCTAIGRVQYVDAFFEYSDSDTSNLSFIHYYFENVIGFDDEDSDIRLVGRQFRSDGTTKPCFAIKLAQQSVMNVLRNVDTLVVRHVRSMAEHLAEHDGGRIDILKASFAGCMRVRRLVLFSVLDAWDGYKEDEEDTYPFGEHPAFQDENGDIGEDEDENVDLEPEADVDTNEDEGSNRKHLRSDKGEQNDHDNVGSREPEEKKHKPSVSVSDSIRQDAMYCLDAVDTVKVLDNPSLKRSILDRDESAALNSHDAVAMPDSPSAHTAAPRAGRTSSSPSGIVSAAAACSTTTGHKVENTVLPPVSAAALPAELQWQPKVHPVYVVDRTHPKWWVPLSRHPSLTDDKLIGLFKTLGALQSVDTLELGPKWFLCFAGRVDNSRNVLTGLLAALPKVRTLYVARGEMSVRRRLDWKTTEILASRVAEMLCVLTNGEEKSKMEKGEKGNGSGEVGRQVVGRQVESVVMDMGYFGHEITVEERAGDAVNDKETARVSGDGDDVQKCESEEKLRLRKTTKMKKKWAVVSRAVVHLEDALALFDERRGSSGVNTVDVRTVRANCEKLKAMVTAVCS